MQGVGFRSYLGCRLACSMLRALDVEGLRKSEFCI